MITQLHPETMTAEDREIVLAGLACELEHCIRLSVEFDRNNERQKALGCLKRAARIEVLIRRLTGRKVAA